MDIQPNIQHTPRLYHNVSIYRGVRGTNSEGERGARGPETREEENVHELSGAEPRPKMVLACLRRSPLLTADASKFFTFSY